MYRIVCGTQSWSSATVSKVCSVASCVLSFIPLTMIVLLLCTHQPFQVAVVFEGYALYARKARCAVIACWIIPHGMYPREHRGRSPLVCFPLAILVCDGTAWISASGSHRNLTMYSYLVVIPRLPPCWTDASRVG